MAELDPNVRQEVVRRVLVLGCEDWVRFREIEGIVLDVMTETAGITALGPDDSRDSGLATSLAVEVSVSMCDEGLLTPGRYESAGFCRWSERGDALRRRIMDHVRAPWTEPVACIVNVMFDPTEPGRQLLATAETVADTPTPMD
ncbi:hypothetical protein AB0333_15895 [Citricoccus sp. NPDC079358]|uniref:hypothetical protein n=1 Tax=Citricoccus sp. NPDC079358 TaxID=3154653 RepID=UPI00344DFB28